MAVKCLENCDALCCKCDLNGIHLRSNEAKALTQAGTKLIPTGLKSGVPQGMNEYRRIGRCVLEDGGKCMAHEKPVVVRTGVFRLKKITIPQPITCELFPQGKIGCLRLRMNNPELDVNRTEEDRQFAEWYKSRDPNVPLPDFLKL
jgi:hypothetical protein